MAQDQYKFTIQFNTNESVFNTPYSFDVYSVTSSPVLTSTMIPYIERFLTAASLSSTPVATVSAAVDSIDGLGA